MLNNLLLPYSFLFLVRLLKRLRLRGLSVLENLEVVFLSIKIPCEGFAFAFFKGLGIV
jgi:hypothetical protein